MTRYLDAKEAAAMLGVRRTFFLTKVAPFVPHYNFGTPNKAMRRYRADDLARWADARKVG